MRRVPRRISLPLARKALPALLALLGGVALACSGTTGSETVTPITGITVRAETLTAGKGCGRAPTQVFKYAAIVLGLDDKNEFTVRVASQIYDCFTDGTFVELPASSGRTEYGVLVYAFNQTAWDAAGGDAKIRSEAERYQTFVERTSPTWSTRCDAAQSDLVQSLARCDALSPTSTAVASVDIATATFKGGEAGTLQCGVDFASLVYRSAVNGGAPGATAQAACGATLSISPAVAPASYAVEVGLVRADGTPLGRTVCTATTSPGVKSSAVCDAVK